MHRIVDWRVTSAAALILLSATYALVSYFLANGVTKAERSELLDSPSRYALPFDNVAFPTRGGTLTLKGWYIAAPDKQHTIIFVHGLGSNRTGDEALAIAAQLWNEGFNILMFDLRGHGVSDDGRISGGYFEQNDLLGAFDFLRSKEVRPRDIGVLGFSLGAAASILGAAKEPGIHALVADTTYANISELITQEVSRTTPIPSWLVPLFTPGTTLAAKLVYNIEIREMVPENAVNQLRYPILLIHGTDDSRIPPEHSARVHRAAHPDSILWYVTGAEHLDAFREQPQEYAHKISGYFNAQLGHPNQPSHT